jgi:hypothetical protein
MNRINGAVRVNALDGIRWIAGIDTVDWVERILGIDGADKIERAVRHERRYGDHVRCLTEP